MAKTIGAALGIGRPALDEAILSGRVLDVALSCMAWRLPSSRGMLRRRVVRGLAACVGLCLVLLASACSLDDVDLTAKRCPCAIGWHCDELRELCVPRLPRTDGEEPVDSGTNAPTEGRDAGDGWDAGPGSAFDAGLDAGPDAPELDAGTPTDAGPAEPADSGPDSAQPTCTTPGEQLPPVGAFVGFPTLDNIVCGVDEVLVQDGMVTGLDRPRGGALGMIEGHGVTACVGVDFGFAESFPDFVIRAGGTGNACGVACGSECGYSTYMRVFRATTSGAWTNADHYVELTRGSLTDYRIRLTGPTRYILVCRGGAGPAADDVSVDSILATCPP